ncbi:MAG: polysaccharide deacetylase family protein [Syntrophobacteraceae bacterium]|jgi:peptidoglycan/xylan/chitin deacetylase (PgdA/CDA1 family)
MSKLTAMGRRLTLSLPSVTDVLRIGKYFPRRNLIVLTYHRIVPREQCPDGLRPENTLFVDEFEMQMAFVSRRYKVLTGEQVRAIITGAATIPRYSLAISFDDGYENNYLHAFPVLQRYGLKAIFFVTTGRLDREARHFWWDRLDWLHSRVSTEDIAGELRRLDPYLHVLNDTHIRLYFKTLPGSRQTEILDRLEQRFGTAEISSENRIIFDSMSWDQVRSMASAGMTIGSHTVSHQILSAAGSAQVYTEVFSSRQRIQEETGQECWCFCYPNGERWDFRPSDEHAVLRAGYLCAFALIPGAISNHTSRYALPRIPIMETGDIRILQKKAFGP